jgi:hypothetical protein
MVARGDDGEVSQGCHREDLVRERANEMVVGDIKSLECGEERKRSRGIPEERARAAAEVIALDEKALEFSEASE